MFDIDGAVGATPCLTADDDHGFEIHEAEVIYWGHCPPCRKSARAAETVAAAQDGALARSGNPRKGSIASPRQK